MRQFLKVLMGGVAVLSLLLPCHSAPEFPKGSLILDEEIDTTIGAWVSEIFSVARLNGVKPKIYIVVDPDINAAAAPGARLIINTGLIMQASHVGQLLGVLAHEVGHLASGHVSPLEGAFEESLMNAGIAMLVGGLSALLTNNPGLLAAGFLGGAHVMDRSLLRFSRTQESAADQAALSYLERLKWPATGLVDFFKLIQSRSPLMLAQISKYALTHPLSLERIQACTNHAAYKTTQDFMVPDHMIQKFERLKAKIEGFLLPPDTIFEKYKESSVPAMYARSIAYYRKGKTKEALDLLDGLQKETPNDPYYHELRGQILFEAGQVDGAVKALKTAHQLRPNSALISILLAQAYLELKGELGLQEALTLLIPLSQTKDKSLFVWRLMAVAYGRQNKQPLAALCLAEEAFEKREFSFAKIQAEKAKKGLSVGSKAYVRADDLIQQLLHIKPTR